MGSRIKSQSRENILERVNLTLAFHYVATKWYANLVSVRSQLDFIARILPTLHVQGDSTEHVYSAFVRVVNFVGIHPALE